MPNFTRSDMLTKHMIDGIEQVDYKSNPLKDVFSGQVSYYVIEQSDIQRPTEISLKIYGDAGYWDILMKFNGIIDIWTEIEPGKIIRYPPLVEMQRYFK